MSFDKVSFSTSFQQAVLMLHKKTNCIWVYFPLYSFDCRTNSIKFSSKFAQWSLESVGTPSYLYEVLIGNKVMLGWRRISRYTQRGFTEEYHVSLMKILHCEYS